MDNQQDQFGTSDAADQTSQNPSATASGASASSRKSAANPSAQSTSATPDASSQTTANAGADRQGEGQQTNDQEGTLLDTALNSGKKWIEDSGVLNNVNQLPQSVKDWGSRTLSRVNELSTTQKVVGGAILAAGLGWLALRKGKSAGSSSSDSASYNYGKQRDTGSYGRRSYGYQASDASTSRKSASGASSRADSGSPYGNSGSRYGGSGSSYASGADSADRGQSASSSSGILGGSGRSETSTGASAFTDHGARTSESSHRNDDFRSIE